MSSLTNKIIANIKSVTKDISRSFINSENVICIDSSNNRIGINTKTPQYSIDISGSDSINALNTYDLWVRNIAHFETISSNIIDTSSINLSGGIYITLSGNRIDVSNIYIKPGGISMEFMYVPNISGDHLHINTISCESLDVDIMTISGTSINNNTLQSILNFQDPLEAFYRKNIDCSNIIGISAEFNEIYALDICTNDLSAINIDVSNIINKYIKTHLLVAEVAKIQTGDFSNINVTGDASFNGNINFAGELIGTMSSYSSLNIGNNTNPVTSADITNLRVNDINIMNNIAIDDSFIYTKSNKGYNFKNAKEFLLPEQINANNTDGNLVYDYISNELKLYTNGKWNPLIFDKQFINLKLDSTITGNSASINNNIWIPDISELIISTTNYKYIPITQKNTNNTYYDICDNKLLKIKNNSTDFFEINASISIQFLNKIPGDVEANNYTFGIYSNNNDANYAHTSNQNISDCSLITIKNSILVLDNSYNYATSNINYICQIKNNNDNDNDSYNGIYFYISSEKDLDYLLIDSFNCTIKQI